MRLSIFTVNYDFVSTIQLSFLETIRSYPGQPIILRQCGHDYKIPDSNVVIEKDTTVFVPRYGLNHDEEHYANPHSFDPEHFSEEAKASRHPYAHLLFGDGPRKCLGKPQSNINIYNSVTTPFFNPSTMITLGMRFGQMHSKLALTMLLRHYEFTMSPKMKLPVKYTSNVISTSIVGGVWLRCTKRAL